MIELHVNDATDAVPGKIVLRLFAAEVWLEDKEPRGRP